jgi:hypothetical protein
MRKKTHVGLHVRCPLLWSNFNQKYNVSKRAVSRSLTTECTLTDQETFGMKSQKEEALAHPGL